MKYLVSIALFALAMGANAQQPEPPTKAAPNVVAHSELPVEVLAHFFLSSSSAEDRLKKSSIVSEAGLRKMKSANATHWQKVHGGTELAIESRQLCKEVTKAKSGTEFGEAFIQADKRERERLGKAASLTLAELSAQDRSELLHWLDTEYRKGFSGNGLGSNLVQRFESAPFPNANTDALTKKVCDTAAEYEKRSKK